MVKWCEQLTGAAVAWRAFVPRSEDSYKLPLLQFSRVGTNLPGISILSKLRLGRIEGDNSGMAISLNFSFIYVATCPSFQEALCGPLKEERSVIR